MKQTKLKPVKQRSATFYSELLADVKARIREGQTRAMWAANAEMVATYADVGRLICKRQKQEAWGSGILQRLAKDLRNELSAVKGFSVRNLQFMVQFYKEYHIDSPITKRPVSQLKSPQEGQPPVGQLTEAEKVKQLVSQIPWAHNIALMQKIKDLSVRHWYMQQILEQGWSRDVLVAMIKSKAHKRQGKASSNFKLRLPLPQSDLAQQMLKDPYVFDFATIAEPFRERELETNLIKHLEQFAVD